MGTVEHDDHSGKHDEQDTDRAPLQRLNPMLTRRGAVIGMAAVAGVAAVDVGSFLYAGGWLTPRALTPSRFAGRFEQVYGHHHGFRRDALHPATATATAESPPSRAGLAKRS